MISLVLALVFLKTIDCNYALNGKFKECLVNTHHNLLKVDKCPDLSFREFINDETAVDNRKEGEAIVLTKHQYVLEGIGQECAIIVRHIKLSTSFFGTKYTEQNENFVRLSRFECLNMISNQVCNGKNMSCSNKEHCIFKEQPDPAKDVHPWLFGSHAFILHECKFSQRLVIADSFEKNVLHESIGTCRVEDLYCELSQSIVIWERAIIRKCLFERIMYIKDLRSVRNTNGSVLFYYSQIDSMFFKVQANNTIERDCGAFEFISTTEGLFLSLIKQKGVFNANQTRKALMSLPESKVKSIHLNDNELRKILMSQDDFALFTVLKMNLITACSNFLNIIRTNQNNDDTFLNLSEMGYSKDLIIYFNNGVSYMPICTDVYNITVFKQQKIKDTCYEDIQIIYKNEKSQKYRRGFLRKNGIITQSSRGIACYLMESFEKSIVINDILITKKNNQASLINLNHTVKTIIRNSLWNTNELQRLFDHNSFLTNGSTLFDNIEDFDEDHFQENSGLINDIPTSNWDDNENDDVGFFSSFFRKINSFFSSIWHFVIKCIVSVVILLLIVGTIYLVLKCALKLLTK